MGVASLLVWITITVWIVTKTMGIKLKGCRCYHVLRPSFSTIAYSCITSEKKKKKRKSWGKVSTLIKLLHVNIVYSTCATSIFQLSGTKDVVQDKTFSWFVVWSIIKNHIGSYFMMHRAGKALFFIIDDVCKSLKEGLALAIRNHKVYCKVLRILLIHRAASVSTEWAN